MWSNPQGFKRLGEALDAIHTEIHDKSAAEFAPTVQVLEGISCVKFTISGADFGLDFKSECTLRITIQSYNAKPNTNPNLVPRLGLG